MSLIDDTADIDDPIEDDDGALDEDILEIIFDDGHEINEDSPEDSITEALDSEQHFSLTQAEASLQNELGDLLGADTNDESIVDGPLPNKIQLAPSDEGSDAFQDRSVAEDKENASTEVETAADVLNLVNNLLDNFREQTQVDYWLQKNPASILSATATIHAAGILQRYASDKVVQIFKMFMERLRQKFVEDIIALDIFGRLEEENQSIEQLTELHSELKDAIQKKNIAADAELRQLVKMILNKLDDALKKEDGKNIVNVFNSKGVIIGDRANVDQQFGDDVGSNKT